MKRSVAFLSLIVCSVSSADAQTLEWTRQLGTSGSDIDSGVSADALGNVYISGYTDGSLEGVNAGLFDAFLSKYNASGELQWTQQIGTSEVDKGNAVTVDGLGNVYISGETKGSLGGTNLGRRDVFLSKYDADGTLQWSRQRGTSEAEWSNAVSTDTLGNVYLSGSTHASTTVNREALLAKYDANGTLQWTRQSDVGGFNESESLGVSADGLGSVYISGVANIHPNTYAFVSKYAADGVPQWTRLIDAGGTEWSRGVSADGQGNVYIGGQTRGSLDGVNAGGTDSFLRKYNDSGELQWTRQFGSAGSDESRGVFADRLGNIYITGYDFVDGDDGAHDDAFLRKYDAHGTLQWSRQLGTSGSHDLGVGVSADGLGHVYISGTTAGSLGGTNAGGADVFVAKFSAVPEPALFTLFLPALIWVMAWRTRRPS